MNPIANEKVVLFDGVCSLCASSVQFILRHDRTRSLRFASIQSRRGHHLYEQHGFDPEEMVAMVLVTPVGVYSKSDAAIHIARHFSGLWRWLAVFRLIPKPIRDWAYSVIARNRYRWFGRKETCMVPSQDYRDRFLD